MNIELSEVVVKKTEDLKFSKTFDVENFPLYRIFCEPPLVFWLEKRKRTAESGSAKKKEKKNACNTCVEF